MAPGEISRGINWDNGATEDSRRNRFCASFGAEQRGDISLLENVTESAAMHIQRNELRFNEGCRRLSGRDRHEMYIAEGEFAINWDRGRDEKHSDVASVYLAMIARLFSIASFCPELHCTEKSCKRLTVSSAQVSFSKAA